MKAIDGFLDLPSVQVLAQALAARCGLPLPADPKSRTAGQQGDIALATATDVCRIGQRADTGTYFVVVEEDDPAAQQAVQALTGFVVLNTLLPVDGVVVQGATSWVSTTPGTGAVKPTTENANPGTGPAVTDPTKPGK